MDVANEASVIASLNGCEDETNVELFRSASPDEIAVAALFLLDDRKARFARFAPGHILNVDGGFPGAGSQPDPR